MAYPTVSGPYGLRPINLIGGQVFAGSTRNFPIASGYATAIGYGDVVKLSSGTLVKETGTTTATPVGVFLGCSYTDPVLKYKLFSQQWPASTVASDAVAIVSDDPDILMKVAVVSGTTVVAGVALADVLGKNMALVQNAVNTATGDSAVAVLSSSAATTISLPVRVVDVVQETKDSSGNYTEVIVKWNAPYFTLAEGTPNTITWAGGHQYLNPLGA